jgi:hypothetical protein
LTLTQLRSVEAAVRTLPDQSWAEGFRRQLAAELGPPPWSNAQVGDAILTVFAASSMPVTDITVGFLLHDDLRTLTGAGRLAVNATVV